MLTAFIYLLARGSVELIHELLSSWTPPLLGWLKNAQVDRETKCTHTHTEEFIRSDNIYYLRDDSGGGMSNTLLAKLPLWSGRYFKPGVSLCLLLFAPPMNFRHNWGGIKSVVLSLFVKSGSPWLGNPQSKCPQIPRKSFVFCVFVSLFCGKDMSHYY